MASLTLPLPGPSAADWVIRRFRALLATFVVNGGTAIVTSRIKGAGSEPLNIGWGTGAGTTAKTDTALFGEKDVDLAAGTGSRTAGTSSQVTTTNGNDTYQVTGIRQMTAAGPVAVTNAGLFDNAAIGSGALFMKGDFAAINLSQNDSIAFTFKVQVTN